MGGMGESKGGKAENMKSEISKMAKLLRTSKKVVLDLEKKMEKISGKKGVIEKIVEKNDKKIKGKLKELGFDVLKLPIAEQVYQVLIDKTKQSDDALYKHFHQPDFSTTAGCGTLINATKELTGGLTGFYLKEKKAKELLKANPPRQIMTNLGYGNDIDKMLEKEDCFEIFCGLRFAEDNRWLNDVFFRAYYDLKKEDFEKRKIKVIVLPEKWLGIGQKFLGKKLHHMSHLKELGIVFVIPIKKWYPGETLYLFFMTLHYAYEVDWYSRLFKIYSKKPNFAQKMISALKVEASGRPLPDSEKNSWRILHKYLAKDDPNDPRLAEPHINSEAWHYTKTARDIKKFADRFPDAGLGFWRSLDVSGDYFSENSSGRDVLISFDLFDNGISLLQRMGFESKYLYHQQEALWNKLFTEYMGEKVMDKLMMDNLDKGFVVL